jgi:hypothetical protein
LLLNEQVTDLATNGGTFDYGFGGEELGTVAPLASDFCLLVEMEPVLVGARAVSLAGDFRSLFKKHLEGTRSRVDIQTLFSLQYSGFPTSIDMGSPVEET